MKIPPTSIRMEMEHEQFEDRYIGKISRVSPAFQPVNPTNRRNGLITWSNQSRNWTYLTLDGDEAL